ncbi:MAG: DUF4177 domain-containing protein [bacterium]|nr:DUF4177 domain-containing protein [bacterium]
MNTYMLPCLVLFLALSGPTAGQEAPTPEVVRIEGWEEAIHLLQRVDKGITRLEQSRWEYKVVQRNILSGDLKEKIEALGRDGWELVNATVQEGFIFKRRVMP